jgi:hypothetical protein
MNQSIPSHPQRDTPTWQNIGEIRLPVSPDNGDAILSLLEEKLAPLQLPEELIHRFVKSIQEVSMRLEMREKGMEHVRLFLFVPAHYSPLTGTWGFFRIERTTAEDDSTSPSHTVDLYLYPEGG